jgi:hypothetical protein
MHRNVEVHSDSDEATKEEELNEESADDETRAGCESRFGA